jgi:DNA-binding LytR/AlgR family response regulator
MKVRCLVIDDEPLARKLIISHISRIDTLELAGEFGDAFAVNNFLRRHTVDLLFLDIEMPEMTGFEFLGSLIDRPAVIVTTAHRNFAPEAFDLDVVDYLLKPISFERLYKAVNKFLERTIQGTKSNIGNEDELFIYVKADRKIHKIFLNTIILIESLDEYIRIHMKDRVLVSRETITTMEAKLDRNFFVRIHRSYIVSRRQITSITSDSVELDGRRMLPFGRTFKAAAMSALGLG